MAGQGSGKILSDRKKPLFLTQRRSREPLLSGGIFIRLGMNSKIFFTAIIIAISVQTSFAQSNNLKREVVFTLRENEVIGSGEYKFSQSVDRYNFVCIIYNKATKRNTFVFNGKRIVEENENLKFSEWLSDFITDLTQENGYIFHFWKEEDGKTNHYVNYKGKVNGPFENVQIGKCVSSGKIDFEYLYQIADEWYVHKSNGQNKNVRMYEASISDDGDFCSPVFSAIQNGFSLYIFDYENEINTVISDEEIKLYSPDKEHSFKSTINVVVIDGKIIQGTSPAYTAVYDKTNNAFVWNSVEGRELVVYEYKLD